MIRPILLLSLLAAVAGCSADDSAVASAPRLKPMPKLRAALAKSQRPLSTTPPEAGALLRDFFAAKDDGSRAAIAGKIQALPGYDPNSLSEWLHGAGLFKRMKPGVATVKVKLTNGRFRDVYVRVPQGYTPDAAWPAVYALHPSGGNGYDFLSTVEDTLGDAVDDVVVIAPAGIRQTTVDAPGPENPENALIWREVRRQYHLDPNRMYAFGFSLGGFAAWTNAAMHADMFAGVITFSGTILPLELDKYVDAFARNMQGQKCLLAWGANDMMSISGTGGDGVGPIVGSMSVWNRTLSERMKKTGPETESVENPSRGHSPFPLEESSLARVLTHARKPSPASFDHMFRYLYQSDCYWVRGEAWKGDQWLKLRPDFTARPGEKPNAALDRTIMSLMGFVNAEVSGNEIALATQHLRSATVWLCDPLVTWGKPVTVTVNGHRAFEGVAKRDLLTCLSEVGRTFDFDLLKWQAVKVEIGN